MEFTAISRAGASPLPSRPYCDTTPSLGPFPWQRRADQTQSPLPASAPGPPCMAWALLPSLALHSLAVLHPAHPTASDSPHEPT